MKQKLFAASLALMLAMASTSSRAQTVEGLMSMAQHAFSGATERVTRVARSESVQPFGEEVSFEPGATWDCGFSPNGGALPRVLKAINEVRVRPGDRATILVAAYEFTSVEVARALIAAKQRGVQVAVVADATENQRPASKVGMLKENGIPVRVDNQRQMLHDKFLVLDGTAVETGSFNFTRAAASDEHAENACVIRHSPKYAARFTGHWQTLWRESQPV